MMNDDETNRRLTAKEPAGPSVANSRAFRFALLFALSMTEIMPVALLSSAMPVLLRRAGASMEEIGLLSLVMLPWAIKALWAPVVDKLGAHSRLGRYRSWLFVTHPLLLLTLVLGSFLDVPALILRDRAAGIPALLWLSFVSATADTASHGLAVNLLRPEERGVGNGVQTAGMAAGALVGGGLMVMLIDRMGFRGPLLIMAACVLLPLFGVALYREPPVDPAQRITVRDALHFFRRPRIGLWLAVLAALVFLPSVPGVPFQTLFVDHGMGLTEIGLVMGILSSLAEASGGALGGFAVKSFGRRRAFYALHLFCILCLSLAAWIVTRADPARPLLYLSVLCVGFGTSASGTVLSVMMMDRSRSHLASSDYTVQASAQSTFSFLGSGVGGFLAGWFGATSLFLLIPMVMLALLIALVRVLKASDFEPSQDLQG